MGHDKSGEGPFDLDRLQQLVELMEKHDLRMVKLQKGEERWQLQRGPREVVTAMPTAGFAPAPVAAHPAPQSAAPAAAPPAITAAAAPAGTPIKSPTVGTFYSAPQPGDPPFVRVGDRVTPDKTVCILEAMKVFNSIPAGISGTISKVLASDGDAIEFGQPLFLVTQD